MENVIEIEGLQKSFGDIQVLRDISLTVARGENVVVLGRSGQGKSVAIKCIVRMVEPDAGSLTVLGHDMRSISSDELKELRRRIGFLFQSGALYDSMTVRENLEFPLTRVLKQKNQQEIDALCREVLEAVGLADAIDKMPSELSGGMRKRMALARTLIVKPEIILYDEPTTGLDTITSKEISQLILDMQKKYQTTSIIITHDIPCARITADRILIMDDGGFIAEGTFEELSNSPDAFIRSFFK
ncbi:ABC transporter ATP-binding protein [Sediminibacterium soli]|uniref:ABC transporter ATP-binding protein n=1 Tax=Sediminibacterium soli TaxID=2698829 RepID=UPI001379805A|nr:ATP-binding cassette domain-containing protein [Sediminibacterium soli]NCI45873.1 ATP-binding cassette domain-containing protein [Sediminibacterium soli]